MNDFSSQQPNNTPYYPEDLNFNTETQNFSHPNTESSANTQQNMRNPLFDLLNKNMNNGLFSNLLGNNNILSTILSGNPFGGNQKNNMLVQALTNLFNTSKKTPSSSEEHVEKTLETDNFEEI